MRVRLSDQVIGLLAAVERQHGRAQLIVGDERARVAVELGVWHRCVVMDIGAGRVVTVGPRGGGLKVHERAAGDPGAR